MAIEFTANNFKSDVLANAKPVLVDFWAPWCGPCKMVGPVVEKLSRDLAASHVIGKVDIDQHPILAEAFGVTGIPTMILFQDGREVRRLTGFRSEPQLREFLADHAAA